MHDTFHAPGIDHHLDTLLTNIGDHGSTDAQRMIVADFGHHLSENDATHLNAANGWLHAGDNTALEGVGHLMQAHGVDYHRVEHGTIDQIKAELAADHRVIVGLHDQQLGGTGALDTFFHDLAERLGIHTETANDERQAIAIKGLDESDPAHPKVLLYHPKHEGETVAYSLEDFSKAWQGSDFSFVATNASPLEHAHAAPNDDHTLLGDLLSKAVGLGASAWVSSMGLPPSFALESGKLAEKGTEAITSWIKSL